MIRHEPVLLREVLENLNLRPNINVIDCTLGDAGHSEKILEKIMPGKLLGMDADAESLLRAKRFLYRFEDNFIPVRDNFVNLTKAVRDKNFGNVRAILMDLGWSSPQFEERGRGFSFKNSSENLDMRYNAGSDTETAADILNSRTSEDLAKIFRKFGEEKFAKDIANKVEEERENKRIETVGDLVEIVLKVYRKKLKTDKEIPYIGGLHPTTKVFQALRIEVNQELQVLKQALPQAVEILEKGGRLVVITFHSLEDRIVKQYFKSLENKELKIINKKPIIASKDEVSQNPRSGSAKMRVVEKI